MPRVPADPIASPRNLRRTLAVGGLAVLGAAVLLAAPAHCADYSRAFACQAGLGAAQTREMIDRLLDEGVDVNAYSAPMLARQLSQPALYVHSTDEHVVAIADAGAASAAWRGARLLRVDGLGHRRLLSDPEVVVAVTEFVVRSADPVGANGGLVSILV